MSAIKLNEASKLNPGKNAIKASLLGSKTASTLVKTAQGALKEWPSLNRAKKKEIYAKLAELKKAAKEAIGTELKGIKPEQKAAAAEKATQMYASFVAAVKKREKAEDTGEEKPKEGEEEAGSEEEETKVDVSALEKERDAIKEWFVEMQEKMAKIEEEAEKSGDWDSAEKVAMKMQDEAIAKANKYNDLMAKIEDANKSNEAYNILTEWFEFLLEFDADKAADQIKNKAENIEKKAAGAEGEEEPEEEEEEEDDDDAKRDELLDELDELESDEGSLEMDLDDYNTDRVNAIKKYNDDSSDENEKAKKDAINDYNSAKYRIEKERAELSKKIKEVKDKLKALQPRKNESRIIMKFDTFINERYGS